MYGIDVRIMSHTYGINIGVIENSNNIWVFS